MKKRLLSVALCLCMALTLLPTAALATGTAATSVWVNGVELNSTTPYLANNNATSAVASKPSGGYAYFNNGTLTLNNYQNSTSMTVQDTLGVHKIGTAGTAPETSDIWAAIYADGDLNLVLSGTSTVNTKDGNYSSEYQQYSYLAREAACVYVTGALTVSGSGSAALNTGKSFYPSTGNTRENCPCNYGIYAGSLTVNSGTLNLEPAITSIYPNMNGGYDTTTTAKTVTNTNDGGSAFAYGIYSAGSIDINGGSVTAKSVASGSQYTYFLAYGIYAAGTLCVAAGAAVTAGNYKNNNTRFEASWGIYSGGNMTLSGAVTAEAAATSSGITTGIESAAGLTINGSAVVSATAKGSSFDTVENAYGVKGKSVTISGSANVTASAYAQTYSYGVYGGTVTLEGEAVISAKADGKTYATCTAVEARSTLTVPANATYTNGSKDGENKRITASTRSNPVVINCDPSVRIIFDACNGSATENVVTNKLTSLPVPTLTGYTFAGWYPAPNGETAEGAAFTDADKLTYEKAKALPSSATYYAKWTAGADGKTVRTTALVIDDSTASTIDKSSTQGWKWEKDTKTLTLSGANIVTAGQYALVLGASDSVTIALDAGSVNALSAAGGNVANSAGLYSVPGVTLSGAGTLNATGGMASASAGIIANLTVDGATVTATGSRAVSNSDGIKGSLTLTSGAVTANGGKYGLNCTDATINGGTLNATGAAAGINSSGAVTIASGATVTATGTGDTAGSYGLYTGITLAVNGTLIATGGNGASSYGADILGALSGSGSITATGSAATNGSAGLRLQGGSSFFGTLTATGGAGSSSYGILGTNSVVLVTMPTNITASCDATANRHFPVCVAGTLTGLDGKTFPGSIASSAGMIVYDDDTVLASTGYFDPGNNVPFSDLTIKADKTLTIVPSAKLYVASAAAITMETAEETTGKLVNNGWLVLTTDTADTGAKIAALGITGDGNIQAGDTVYSNAGVKNETAIPGGLDLSDGEAETATGKYTYANNELTIEEGVMVLGDVKLPAGKENTVVLKNGAFVRDNLSIVGGGAGKLDITVEKGDSASIGGVKVQQEVTPHATPEDFLLTIGGGGTLASGGISLGFADGYGANDPYDMSAILEKNTTLNITNSLNELGAGITINSSANTGGLTVRGTLAVHTPNTKVSLYLPRITLERGASLSAGCEVAAELLASSGKALTMESGSTFIANGTKASIVIVGDPGKSIGDLVSLPSGYLPSGVSFREFYSSYLPNAKLYTLARQDDVLRDGSDQTAYIPNGGEASVTLCNYNVVGIHTLTFEVNGGSAIPAVSKTDGTTVDLSAYAPTREGYTFVGWYSDEALTMRVTELKLTENTTVYAKWSEDTLPFTDVSENAWYYDELLYAYENGLFAGTSDTTFSPESNMTREQMWMVLGRMAGKAPANMEEARTWAMENDISDGSNPKNNVTREQFVTLLWRFAGSPKSTHDMSAFTDFDAVSDYAKEAMRWAVENGIISGMTATTLNPKGNATRAQVAAILARYKQK